MTRPISKRRRSVRRNSRRSSSRTANLRRNSAEGYIGRKWNSQFGVREIVKEAGDRANDHVYGVMTAGSGLMELIKAKDIAAQIVFDEKNYASRAHARQTQEQEHQAQIVQESWYGFTDSLSPLARKRAIDALNKQVSIRRQFGRRGELLATLVAEGWTVIVRPGGSRRLVDAEQRSYFEEKDLTKLGLDFAEYLVKRAH